MATPKKKNKPKPKAKASPKKKARPKKKAAPKKKAKAKASAKAKQAPKKARKPKPKAKSKAKGVIAETGRLLREDGRLGTEISDTEKPEKKVSADEPLSETLVKDDVEIIENNEFVQEPLDFSKINQEERDRIRDRIKYEDSILKDRTTLFLSVNAALALAIRFVPATAAGENPPDGSIQLFLAIIGIAVSGLWFYAGRKSAKILGILTVLHLRSLDIDNKKYKYPENENGMNDHKWKTMDRYIEYLVREGSKTFKDKVLRSPTNIFGRWLPLTVIGCWIIGILLAARIFGKF
jgi:hypothetical protein